MGYLSVNRSAGGIGAKFLCVAYEAVLVEAARPAGFLFTNAQGLWSRTPEALRPLTLCNCDCKVVTSAMCAGLRKCSVECIHPSERGVAQRIMTDNIFEVETAAVALRTCYAEDPGISSLISLAPLSRSSFATVVIILDVFDDSIMDSSHVVL